MLKTKNLIASAIIAFTMMTLNAQDFATPSMAFSRKKPMYITLTDGTEMTATLKKFKYDKSLIEELVVVDSVTEKKMKITPDKIAFMYVSPTGMDNLMRKMDFATDATKWNDSDINNNIINKGYIYFEQSEVVLKKNKTETLLMQLLNPTFCNGIKVYHDPRAKETASVGVGGVTLAGGDAKSYYIKKGDAPAVKVEKKNYKDEYFSSLFGDCDAVNSKYGSDVSWFQVTEHVVEYTTNCGK